MTRDEFEDLSGNISADTSALVELAHASPQGAFFRKKLLGEDIRCSLTKLTITETHYILCREVGAEQARSKLASLLDSGLLHVEDPPELATTAGGIKCQRALSLVDCHVLALAQLLDAKALFAHREKELLAEMRKKPFSVQIRFLQDFTP